MFLQFIFVLASDIAGSLRQKITLSETQQLSISNLKVGDVIDTRNYVQLLPEGETTKPGFVKRHVKLQTSLVENDSRDELSPKYSAKTRKYIFRILDPESAENALVGELRILLFPNICDCSIYESPDQMEIIGMWIYSNLQNLGFGMSALSGLIEFIKMQRPQELKQIILNDLSDVKSVMFEGLYQKIGFTPRPLYRQHT